jgi:phage terminase large subunit GpA-like protein
MSGQSGLPFALPNKRRRGHPIYVVNTHHWTSQIHSRSRIERGDPNEWRLHAEVDIDYRRQIVAEHREEAVVNGRTVRKWVLHDQGAGNHYLDCEVYAAAAAWLPVGVQRIHRRAQASSPQQTRPRFTMPDGRPFLVTER